MGNAIIQMERIKKSFGRNLVLNDLDLSVPQGIVYGLLGRNGAGKTTTIRILLGLTTCDGGTSKVFGMDSQEDGWKIRHDVGYVAEGVQLYQWMSVAETLWFHSCFYKTWDKNYALSLLNRFDLDASKKVSELSRGMISKLCLTLALAHRPKVLVLDEATTGLDALVRKEFLESIVDFVNQEGMTVFISSHLLADLERVVERIGFLEGGKIKLETSLEQMKQSFRKVKISFEADAPAHVAIPGIIREEKDGRQILLTLRDFSEDSQKALHNLGAREVEFMDMSLEDIFSECLATRAKSEQK